MYAQVSRYMLKPGCRDRAIGLMKMMKPKILDLPGLKRFTNVMGADGTGYVISVSENEEQVRKNEARVKELWAAFSDLLEAMPAIEGYEVIADWQS